MDNRYDRSFDVPTIDDYRRLRAAAGLTARSEDAARAGLPNTVVAVTIRYRDRVVGMGRAIGDGLFYQIVDIAVEPDHQRRGLGKAIMSGLIERLRHVAPAEAYVSLIADGDADKLYSLHGFAPTAPASIGMAQWIGR